MLLPCLILIDFNVKLLYKTIVCCLLEIVTQCCSRYGFASGINVSQDSILGTRHGKYIGMVSEASMALSTIFEAGSTRSQSFSDLAVLISLNEILYNFQNHKKTPNTQKIQNNANETKGGWKHNFHAPKTQLLPSQKCQRISRRHFQKHRKKLNIQMWKSEYSEYIIIIGIEYSGKLNISTCLNIPGERTPIYSKSRGVVLIPSRQLSR